MTTSTKTIAMSLSLLAAGMAIGWALSTAPWGAGHQATAPQASAPAERKVLYWYDPMVPTQKFEKPGKSPFMDMQLVPKYADEASNEAPGVTVSAQTVQSLGVRTATVEKLSLGDSIEAVGTLQLNERDISIVQARSNGFVEKVYARAAGDVIAAGEPLVDVLLPDWVAAQREYLAVRALKDEALSTAARQRLLLLGMPGTLVEQVERSGQPQGITTVQAPSGGLIVELMVRQGMMVAPGMTLARINGLGTLWLEAAVPEAQAGSVQPGQAAQARFAAYPGEVFRGKVAAVLPEASKDTRTLRVRIELANNGQRLKAGMYAQVSLSGPQRQELVVPSEAVIRTGRRALVYLVDEPGRFRPVEVELGAEVQDKLVVRSGLQLGQQVVSSAQFLIDSEASLRGITAAPMAARAASASASGPSAAAPSYSATGTVTEITDDGVMLSHGPVPALKWPPMTMGFKVTDPRVKALLKPKAQVQFRFSSQDGEYLILSAEPMAGAKP